MGTCATKDQIQSNVPATKFRLVKDFDSMYKDSEFYYLKSEEMNIFKAVEISSGKRVIVKAISKNRGIVAPSNEVYILSKLNHPNFIKLHTCFQTLKVVYIIYEDDNSHSVLDHFEKNDSPITLPEIREMFRDIIETIEYLHSNQIAHGKLDFSSIFYRNNQSISIGGFSSLIDFSLLGNNPPKLIDFKSKLTLGMKAPEVLQDKYGFCSDIWSLGIVFHCLVTGNMPFHSNLKHELRTLIEESSLDTTQLKSHGASAELIDLISSMLTKKPEKRPTASEILASKFFSVKRKSNLSMEVLEGSRKELITFAKKSKVIEAIRFEIAAAAMLKSERNLFLENFTSETNSKSENITLDDVFALRESLNIKISDQELRIIFDKIDSKKSGSVNKKEFLNEFVRLRDENSSQNLKSVFDIIDKNQKGSISVREIKDFFAGDPETQEEVKNLESFFRNDNRLSFKDFKEVLHSIDDKIPETKKLS
jgi:calcium-dependent protein kinase